MIVPKTIDNFIGENKWYLLAMVVAIIAVYYYWNNRKGKPRPKEKRKEQDLTKYTTITDKQRKFLETLHPDVKADFYKFVDEANKLPDVKIDLTSAYRSYAKQDELRRTRGKIASTPGRSPHQYGLAIDMVIHYKGERLGLAGAKSKWLASGVPAIGKRLGMTWGGDFVSHPYDPVHFDVVKREKLNTTKLMEAGKKQFGSYLATRGNELDLSLGKA